jgi:hypothetical protein
MKVRRGSETHPDGFSPRRLIEGSTVKAEERHTGFRRGRAAKQLPECKPMHDALSAMERRQECQRIDVRPPERILPQRNPPVPLTLPRKLYLIERKFGASDCPVER